MIFHNGSLINFILLVRPVYNSLEDGKTQILTKITDTLQKSFYTQDLSASIVSPFMEFIGSLVPIFNQSFINYDTQAMRLVEGNHMIRKMEIFKLFPSFSFILDFRFFPALIAVLIFGSIIFSKFSARAENTKKNLISVFYLTLLFKIVASLTIILLGSIFTSQGGILYFLTFSNLWYGCLASHFFIAVFDILAALLILFYLRFGLRWRIKNDPSKMNINFINSYFNFLQLFGKYTLYVAIAASIFPIVVGYVITPGIAYILPMLEYSTGSAILSYFSSIYYITSGYIKPFVELLVSGRYFDLFSGITDIVNSLISIFIPFLSQASYIEYISPVVSTIIRGLIFNFFNTYKHYVLNWISKKTVDPIPYRTEDNKFSISRKKNQI